MARLAAKSKVLFYPTPAKIMALIASNLTKPDPSDPTGAILDPCAGTGAPAQLLAERYHLRDRRSAADRSCSDLTSPWWTGQSRCPMVPTG